MNWSLVGSLLFGWLIIHTEPRSSPLRLSSYCGSFLSNRTVETRVLPRGNRNAISAALKHSPTVPVFNRLRGGGISGFQQWFMSQFPESVIQASHLHPLRVVFPCTTTSPSFFSPGYFGANPGRHSMNVPQVPSDRSERFDHVLFDMNGILHTACRNRSPLLGHPIPSIAMRRAEVRRAGAQARTERDADPEACTADPRRRPAGRIPAPPGRCAAGSIPRAK